MFFSLFEIGCGIPDKKRVTPNTEEKEDEGKSIFIIPPFIYALLIYFFAIIMFVIAL